MAKPPKLANIESLDDFSHWLADTMQEKVSKENAGFVQIVRSGLVNFITPNEVIEISPGNGKQFILTLTEGAS